MKEGKASVVRRDEIGELKKKHNSGKGHKK